MTNENVKKQSLIGSIGAGTGAGSAVLILKLFSSALGVPTEEEMRELHESKTEYKIKIENLEKNIEKLEWDISWIQYGKENNGPPPPPHLFMTPPS